MGRGQTHRQTDRQTDIATTRKNWPKGRFFENKTLWNFQVEMKRIDQVPKIGSLKVYWFQLMKPTID